MRFQCAEASTIDEIDEGEGNGEGEEIREGEEIWEGHGFSRATSEARSGGFSR